MEFSSSYANLYNQNKWVPNVVQANFDSLEYANNSEEGEPQHCAKCNAVLSYLSKLEQSSMGRCNWKCEFCNHENKDLKISPDEKPDKSEVNYLLEPGNNMNASVLASHKNVYDSVTTQYVIFCVDVSSSMSWPIKIKNNQEMSQISQMKSKLESQKPESKVFENEKTYNRLDVVKYALTERINEISKNNPEKRVGLVTFNRKVEIIGDGLNEDYIKLGKEEIDDKEKIANKVQRVTPFNSISKKSNTLKNKIVNLKSDVGTALGPAMLASILIAGQKPGSQVIVCTDGLANMGIGKFKSDKIEPETKDFYNSLAELAQTKGVSVSIITIEGTECYLEVISEVVNKTNGTVDVVNILEIKKSLDKAYEHNLIATNATMSLYFPQEIYVSEEPDGIKQISKIEKTIGNIIKDTKLSFEYGLKSSDSATSVRDSLKKFPTQLQIQYKAQDGSLRLKSITTDVEVTDNRKLIEENANKSILTDYVLKNKLEKVKTGWQYGNTDDEQLNYILKINSKKNDTGFSEVRVRNLDKQITSISQRASNFVIEDKDKSHPDPSLNNYPFNRPIQTEKYKTSSFDQRDPKASLMAKNDKITADLYNLNRDISSSQKN